MITIDRIETFQHDRGEYIQNHCRSQVCQPVQGPVAQDFIIPLRFGSGNNVADRGHDVVFRDEIRQRTQGQRRNHRNTACNVERQVFTDALAG